MTDEDLTTGAEGAEKPLSNEIMDADSMAAQAGLEDAAHQGARQNRCVYVSGFPNTMRII